MKHIKNFLKDNRSVSIDVNINKNGIVKSFKSDFGDETIEEIQTIINRLIEQEYVTKLDDDFSVTICDGDVNSLDIYHNIKHPDFMESFEKYNTCVEVTPEFLNSILI